MTKATLVWVAGLGALFASCRGGQSALANHAAIQVSLAPLQQALNFVDLAALGDVSLEVRCKSGAVTSASVTAVDVNAVTFSLVPSCGKASLTLTVKSKVESVTAFVGQAEATLVPGAVTVEFSGPTYGELRLNAAAQSWQCQFVSQSASAGAVPSARLTAQQPVTLPLPVGLYTQTCVSDSGSTDSQSVSVSVGRRLAVAVPKSTTTPTPPRLSSLSVTPALPLAFDPAVTQYEATIAAGTTNVAIVATAATQGATLALNGQPYTSGTTATVTTTSTSLVSLVVALNGATSSYTITFKRSALSSNAGLASLAYQAAGGQPVQPLLFVPSQHKYAYLVTNSVDKVLVTATPQADSASVALNGQPGATINGQPGATLMVPLAIGSNIINIEVSAADRLNRQSYQLTLTRAPAFGSNDTSLLSIYGSSANGVSAVGALRPAFAPATLTYSLYVSSERSSLLLSALTADPLAKCAVQSAIPTLGACSAGYSTATLGQPFSATITVSGRDVMASPTTYTVQVLPGFVTGLYIAEPGATLPFKGTVHQYNFPFPSPSPTPLTSVTVNGSVVGGGSMVTLKVDGGPIGVARPLEPGKTNLIQVTGAVDQETENYTLRFVETTKPKADVIAVASKNPLATDLSLYALDAAETSLTKLTGSAQLAGEAIDLVADPSGHFLLASTADNLQLWNVGKGGTNLSLVPAADPPIVALGGERLVIDPYGRFVVTTTAGSTPRDTVALYLLPPYAAKFDLAFLQRDSTRQVDALAMDPSGQYLYFAETFPSTKVSYLGGYLVGPNGELTPFGAEGGALTQLPSGPATSLSVNAYGSALVVTYASSGPQPVLAAYPITRGSTPPTFGAPSSVTVPLPGPGIALFNPVSPAQIFYRNDSQLSTFTYLAQQFTAGSATATVARGSSPLVKLQATTSGNNVVTLTPNLAVIPAKLGAGPPPLLGPFSAFALFQAP